MHVLMHSQREKKNQKEIGTVNSSLCDPEDRAE
jgi:hypothetical protein